MSKHEDRPPTQAERSRARREQILDAAFHTFSRRGYRDTAVDEIATAAETSKGGVYFHFPTKEAIFRELVKTTADRLAAKVERAVAEETEPIATLHGTEQIVEGREELKSVMEHLQQLPDDRRDALIMRFALGMDNREIARALGRSDGATKVLIHRAIKQLEEEMSVDGG